MYQKYSLISIHPMLRFNGRSGTAYSRRSGFQYILCYGSTVIAKRARPNQDLISIHPMLRFNPVKKVKSKKSQRISIHPMLRFNLSVNLHRCF